MQNVCDDEFNGMKSIKRETKKGGAHRACAAHLRPHSIDTRIEKVCGDELSV